MSRVALTVQSIARAGITPTFGALNASTDGGNSFPNNGQTFLEVKNASGAPITVTFYFPATSYVDGAAVASKTVTVALTTGDKMIGPFPPGIYNQPDGSVYFDIGATITSVTAGAFNLQN
jgi:hypothetical protein